MNFLLKSTLCIFVQVTFVHARLMQDILLAKAKERKKLERDSIFRQQSVWLLTQCMWVERCVCPCNYKRLQEQKETMFPKCISFSSFFAVCSYVHLISVFSKVVQENQKLFVVLLL